MLIGYAYIVGDILHVGHLLHLRNCKGLCDRLIVGVLTDRAAMENKPRPAIPFPERLQLVRSICWVNAVVAQETYSPAPNILEIQPDILFECADHKIKQYPQFKGRIIAMPYYPKQSSTKIKEKIKGDI